MNSSISLNWEKAKLRKCLLKTADFDVFLVLVFSGCSNVPVLLSQCTGGGGGVGVGLAPGAMLL